MPPLTRATCPLCGRRVPLRRNGALREHRAPNAWPPANCKGSGERP